MNKITVDARLQCAGAMVRSGVRIADVGTDHAYLPIYLVQSGRIPGGVATDINQGPIARAKTHIEKAGLSHCIAVRRCDGLDGIDNDTVQDIVICGMGGELIARILADSEYVRSPEIHLILQPMSAHGMLRKWLWDNGFEILEEQLCQTDRIYQVLLAHHTGHTATYTAAELLLGKYHMRFPEKSPLLSDFLALQNRFISEKLEGKRLGKLDTSEEETLLCAISALRNRL